MQALQQEVYIPKNHLLNIKVPKEIPSGKTEICIVFQKAIHVSNDENTFKGELLELTTFAQGKRVNKFTREDAYNEQF